MRQKTSFYLALSVLIFAAALIAPRFIYGSAQPVSIKSDPLAAAVADSLVNPSSGYMPIENKDYTISDKNSFDGGKWVVVSVKPIGNAVDPGKIVFEKNGTAYTKALGPSNFFQTGDLVGLPTDVADFLLPGGSQ